MIVTHLISISKQFSIIILFYFVTFLLKVTVNLLRFFFESQTNLLFYFIIDPIISHQSFSPMSKSRQLKAEIRELKLSLELFFLKLKLQLDFERFKKDLVSQITKIVVNVIKNQSKALVPSIQPVEQQQLPVKSEPTIDYSTIENVNLPEQQLKVSAATETSNKENLDNHLSCVCVSGSLSTRVNLPADVLTSNNPAIGIDIQSTGPGPPKRYNLRFKPKGKKDVCCINGCR